MVIGTIDRRAINRWREELLRAGYKTTYLRTIHAQLSSILNYAMEYYGLPSNPSEAVGGFSKHTVEKMDFWTLEEFQRFAMAALQLPHHIMAFYLLFWTGMRVGEMLALTWDDVDFETNSISITKTLYRLQKTSYVSTTKTISGDEAHHHYAALHRRDAAGLPALIGLHKRGAHHPHHPRRPAEETP